MKRLQILVVFLVLSVSLMYTAEAARSRTSNQNSFRRAANGIYQTLSSVFGEDNIRGSYKVSLYDTGIVSVMVRFDWSEQLRQSCSQWRPGNKRAPAWPTISRMPFWKISIYPIFYPFGYDAICRSDRLHIENDTCPLCNNWIICFVAYQTLSFVDRCWA